MEKVYAVTSPILSAFKLGAWTGDYCKLKRRYNTYYGRDCEVVVYSCYKSRFQEAQLKVQLVQYHIVNELYQLDGLPLFHQCCSTQCIQYTLLDRSAIATNYRMASRLKRHAATHEEITEDVGEHLLNLQDALSEIIEKMASGDNLDTALLEQMCVDKKALIQAYQQSRRQSSRKRKFAPVACNMMIPLSNNVSKAQLLNSPDLSQGQVHLIHASIGDGKATEAEYCAAFKHHLKIVFGLRRIDGCLLGAINHHEAGFTMAVQESIALDTLTPLAQSYSSASAVADHTQGLLLALGFAHMYDSETQVSDDMVLNAQHNLQKSSFFSQYQSSIKLYAPQATAALDISNPQMVYRAVSRVFAKAGLKLIRNKSGRSHGSRRSYTIHLCRSATEVHAELMKIKLGNEVDHVASPVLKQYMNNIACRHFIHLA